MGRFIDLTGKKIGRLTVLIRVENAKPVGCRFFCICDCGVEKIIRGQSLRRGDTRSCGCLQLEWAKSCIHGLSDTRVYTAWEHMIARCLNKRHKNYRNYGGRGITVCKRWRAFENFYKDMGEKPENKVLDRINNNSGYRPSNCRWATFKQSASNTRRNIHIKIHGKTKTISEWSRVSGINHETIRSRLIRGYPPSKVLIPIHSRIQKC